MQFSFLGYSVKKIMELDLDVKDVAILRYFDDFMQSGKMNYEVIDGVKYYWISYQNIENQLPFLGLGKRSIMMRMLKLRDLGVLSHYTKKEGGTFSYYTLGKRYKELLPSYDNNGDDKKHNNKFKDKIYGKEPEDIYNKDIYDKDIYSDENSKIDENKIEDLNVCNNEEGVQSYEESNDIFCDFEEGKLKDEEGLCKNTDRPYSEKCSTNNNLLNNSSTIVNDIYINIKEKVVSILDYLNLKVGVKYKSSNTKTIKLIRTRLKEGFSVEDFKVVIDKKVKAWKGTLFEQYLTPFTLFGDKFEVYLNQNILLQERNKNNRNYNENGNYKSDKSLRFHNFKGRDYDYDELERKLLACNI